MPSPMGCAEGLTPCLIGEFSAIRYDIGDELLSYWAELIAEGARPGETFGRISGDNFALLRC